MSGRTTANGRERQSLAGSPAGDRRLRRKTVMVCCGGLLCIAVLTYMFCLPKDLFKGACYSTVMTDRHGELLGARIAEDGQWRFPPSDTVPEKFAVAITEFEDRWFRVHPGVNPVSLVKAAWRNISAGHVVSGGSTLTMQVIRLSRQRERTVGQKIIECILATRLELRCSKDEIMALYAAHAPFGGNVVGLEAASWRYFGKPSSELSWGEAATLAVLPNAPSMIHPGKNREQLKSKRDRLLKRLAQRKKIDEETCLLACAEPLPDEPLPLPQYTPHLMDLLSKAQETVPRREAGTTSGSTILQNGAIQGVRMDNGRIESPIDIALQKRVDNILERWNNELSRSGINDLAAVVIDTRSGEILAYCGNTGYGSGREGSQVDILQAPRSTGSILKPLLYCALLQDGEILPKTLLPDIPVNINGFSPQNFDMQFYGAVPADEALARSLNVPAVHMLRRYGVPKFYSLLKDAGMTTLTRPAEDYGLSLILGGAEGKLYEITTIYAEMARRLLRGGNDRTSLWWTMEALKEVNRPDEMDWRMVSSVRKVAWKTGTSYGFRDAWAVGVTPEYAVGVWAGNADGEGVPGLVGARTAGPVMFDIFNILPPTGWFEAPVYGEYAEAEVCPESGCLKGPYCPTCDTLHLPKAALRSAPCPYHKPVTLTADGRFRTTAGDMGAKTINMFLLPPAMEWYYRQHHPEYTALPPRKPGTVRNDNFIPMEFIYPENGSTIIIPRQLDGSLKGIVCNLAHSTPGEKVYWHLDNSYLGCTQYIHQMTVSPLPGPHIITVVDSSGNSLSIRLTITRNSTNL